MKTATDKARSLSFGMAPDPTSMRARQCQHAWCIHCERAYPYGDYRQVGIRRLCPYPDCVGAAVFAWDWPRVRRINPDYPREPARGVLYPLYGRGIHARRPDHPGH